MKEQLISIIVGLVSILLGLFLEITPLRDRIDTIDSVFLGIFTYIISLIIFTNYRLQKMTPLTSHEKEMIDDLKSLAVGKDFRSFDVLWIIALIRARQRVYRYSSQNSIVINGSQIPSFWKEAITSSYSSWLCTDIEKEAEPWGYQWSPKRALQFQQLAIADDARVQRIFILRKHDIVTDVYKDLITKHRQLGVGVRLLSLDYEADKMRLDYFYNRIGTIDFVLVDDDYLLSFEVSRTGENLTLTCTKDKRLVQELRRQYVTMWDNSKNFDEFSILSGTPKT